MNVKIEAEIDEVDKANFEYISRKTGTTPNDAIRIFIKAFERQGGFPFNVRLADKYAVPVVSLPQKNGHSIWPKELDFEDDDIYDELI